MILGPPSAMTVYLAFNLQIEERETAREGARVLCHDRALCHHAGADERTGCRIGPSD